MCESASETFRQAKQDLGPSAQVAVRFRRTDAGAAAKTAGDGDSDPARASGQFDVSVAGAPPARSESYRKALEFSLPHLFATTRSADVEAKKFQVALQRGMSLGQSIKGSGKYPAPVAATCVLEQLRKTGDKLVLAKEEIKSACALALAAGLPNPVSGDSEATSSNGGPPLSLAPIPYVPEKLYAFRDGGFAALTKLDQLVDFTTATILIDASTNSRGVRAGQVLCAVRKATEAACMRAEESVGPNGDVTGTQLTIFSKGARHKAAEANGEVNLRLDAIALDSAGQLVYAYTRSTGGVDRGDEQTILFRRDSEMLLPFSPDDYAFQWARRDERTEPQIQLFELHGVLGGVYHTGPAIRVWSLLHPSVTLPLVATSGYVMRPIIGGDGSLYVFYYQPKTASFRVSVSSDGVSFADFFIDSVHPAWGEAIEAIRTSAGALVLYQGDGNKGLRLAEVATRGVSRQPLSLPCQVAPFGAWGPDLVADDTHVWLTYHTETDPTRLMWSNTKRQRFLDYALGAGAGNKAVTYTSAR